MIKIQGLDESVPASLGRAVTIGKFDGVHVGHQKLISRLVQLATENGLDSAVITFDDHPASVLNPEEQPCAIMGSEQKSKAIEALGADLLVELRFDEQLAGLTAPEFVELVLVERFNVRLVVVGADFRFGRGGAGDVDLLRQLGERFDFSVEIVADEEIDGERASSTRLRALLDAGAVEQVARILGRYHVTEGMVVHGRKIGRSIGFPTANLSRDSQGYLPLDGVYAGWLHSEGQRYPAALSVGINDTFEAVPRLLEAHVLDRDDLDLYDKVVKIEYVGFIRPSQKFDGLESLVAAINQDIAQIRIVLGVA